ncbi:MAG: response regulator [bacterium]|nr:response regulator [bacterium]
MSDNNSAKDDILDVTNAVYWSSLAEPDVMSSFMHLIGHEIGNPLTTVISLISIIEQLAETGPQKEKVQQFCKTIASEAWKISEITQCAVMICSTRAHQSSALRLEQIIRETTSLLERRRKLGNAECLLNLRHGDQEFVGDRNLLAFLLGEVIKAMALLAPAQSEMPTEILIQSSRADSNTLISISLHSAACQTVDLNQLFNPLLARSERGAPIDFGLAAAAAIARRLNYQLQARLNRDLLEISLTIPTSIAEPEIAAKFTTETSIIRETTSSLTVSEKIPPVHSENPTNKKLSGSTMESYQASIGERRKFIIVDDEPEVRNVIKKILQLILQESGVCNFSESSGTEILNHPEQIEDADFILIDLHLEDTDGQSLRLALEKLAPGSSKKVVFLSGSKGDSLIQKALAESGCPIVYKPFTPEELLEGITQITA